MPLLHRELSLRAHSYRTSALLEKAPYQIRVLLGKAPARGEQAGVEGVRRHGRDDGAASFCVAGGLAGKQLHPAAVSTHPWLAGAVNDTLQTRLQRCACTPAKIQHDKCLHDTSLDNMFAPETKNISVSHIGHGSSVTYSVASNSLQTDVLSSPARMHSISAWARELQVLSVRLWADAMTRSSTTSTAPTGTSPRAAAIAACCSASRINRSSASALPQGTSCPPS
jgi:hypothetical protein